jgi:uncharacterized repeat protein (TIGR01451 family)
LKSWRTTSLIAVLAWTLWGASPARAVDNAATGGIGGLNNGTLLNGNGTGQARLSLFAVDLALVKQARDLAGTVLPDSASVSPGQEIWFVLHVDNVTAFPATDVRITDILDEAAFTYVPGTLQQTTVPTGSSDAALWAGAWTPLTDATGAPDDVGSAVDSGGPAGADRITVGAVPPQPNLQLTVPPSSMTAVRFRVRVN